MSTVSGVTLLVYPPLWGDSSSPPLGPAVLAGALAEANLEVVFLDLNLLFLRQLTSKRFLNELHGSMRGQAGGEALAHLVGSNSLVSEVEDAALRTLASLLMLNSKSPIPALTGTADPGARIADFFADARESPARAFWDVTMRHVVAQRVLPLRPTLVGLTLSTSEQVLPAVALARAIREAGIDTRIVAGGPWCTFMSLGGEGQEPAAVPTALFKLFDALCVGPGDEAIVDLARAAPRLPEPLPANIWRAGASPPSIQRVRIASPNFLVMPLSEYFGSAQAQLPLEATRGCYWHRCRYCNYHELNSGYLVKSIARVVEEALTTQVLRPGAFLTFVDDVVAPRRALEIGAALGNVVRRIGRPIHWSTSMRPDAELDADAAAHLRNDGLRRVFIGLEAGSEALLEEVDKGTSLAGAAKLVRTLRGAGIRVAANFILGLPNESTVDRAAAAALAESLELDPSDLSVSRFAIARGSWYHRNMSQLDLDPHFVTAVRANDLLVNFHPPRV